LIAADDLEISFSISTTQTALLDAQGRLNQGDVTASALDVAGARP